MDYLNEYFDDIFNGLKKTIITNSEGKSISFSIASDQIADIFNQVRKNERMIFFCGNGASCTMAEHMSHDFFQNGKINTYSVSETAHLTAISNDLSYDDVFSYRIKRVLGLGDVLVAISSSGNSSNIVKAIEQAKLNKAFVITLSGKKPDNTIRKMGDINIYVPLDTYGYVESAHAVLLHSLLDCYMDKYLGGKH